MSQGIEALSCQEGVVEIRIPARAEWVAVARLSIAAVAHRMPFSLEEIEDLKLAIAEACTTAIQYDHNGGMIDIRCDVTPDALTLIVRHGDSAAKDDARRGDGGGELGLVLIEALMDEVSYAVEPDGGRRLVMTKRLQS